MPLGGFLFGGTDVNANSMSGFTSENAPVDSMGQSMGGMENIDSMGNPMGSSTNPNVDPASQAAGQAYANAAGINQQTNSQTNSAIAGAGGIAHGAGLFTAIDNLVGKGRVVSKRQRVFSRHQAQFAVNQAQRAIAQYKADSAIQEQKLAQSYAGRGLGQSSIQQEGMQYFHDTAARQAAQLDENLTMAQLGQRLVHSQISQSYAQPYIGFWNAIGAMV